MEILIAAVVYSRKFIWSRVCVLVTHFMFIVDVVNFHWFEILSSEL